MEVIGQAPMRASKAHLQWRFSHKSPSPEQLRQMFRFTYYAATLHTTCSYLPCQIELYGTPD